MKSDSRFARWLRIKGNFISYATVLYGTLFALALVSVFAFVVPRPPYPGFIYLTVALVVLAYAAGLAWALLMWGFIIGPRWTHGQRPGSVQSRDRIES